MTDILLLPSSPSSFSMTQRQRAVPVVTRQQNDHDWNNNNNKSNNVISSAISTSSSQQSNKFSNFHIRNPFSRGVVKELQSRQRKRKCIRQVNVALASLLAQGITIGLCLFGYWFFFMSLPQQTSKSLLRSRFNSNTDSNSIKGTVTANNNNVSNNNKNNSVVL